jgi:putative AlgH/UPF0301 family transcriptional regulator
MKNRAAAFTLFLALLAWLTSASALDLDRPFLLVARPQLHSSLFGATVLVAMPAGGGRHAGFIVNRPTQFNLVVAGPGTASSQEVAPLYLGGPVNAEQLFALIRGASSPGGNSFEMLPGLYAAFEPAVLQQIAKTQGENARFLAGHVAWRPGELQAEIDASVWYVLEPDAALVMGAPDGVWEELVRRADRAANAVSASLPPNWN